jgi:alkylated DNA repair protein (DNA oxidative demethylase)
VPIFSEGTVLLRGWLDIDAQRSLASHCLALASAEAGAYVPTVRGGGKMHVRMLCLGRHWNAMTYRYESTRADFDDAPVAGLPDPFATLAQRAAADAGFSRYSPDICIVNFYGDDGRMGVHQDKDERAETIAAGAPIVSLSLGDAARFVLGGLRRRDPTESMWLRSGDVLILGGPSRLRFHGVTRIQPDGGSSALGIEGRINLTFRQY